MILLEDIFNEDANSTDTTVYRKPDGTFWGLSNGKLFQFDPETSGALQVEWEIWNSQQQATDDERVQNSDMSLKLDSKNTHYLDPAQLQREYASKKQYVKQLKLLKQQERQRKEAQFNKHFVTSNDAAEVESKLSSRISEFVSNLRSKDKPTKEIKADETQPDVINNLDPENQFIPLRGPVKSRQDPNRKNKNQIKPLVVFYFDRSGSFNSNGGKNEIIQKKVDLGDRIVDMFKKAEQEEKLECVVKYFSDTVYDSESDALKHSSTNLNEVIDDINKITKGRLANIVVLTDHDGQWATGKAVVSGKVWLVFALNDAPDLKLHITQERGTPDEFLFKTMG